MPGDLGSLGAASLSYKTVSHLLDLLIQSIGTMEKRSVGRLPDVYKDQLELTARLLACAQRVYLARNEWNELEDPMQEIISDIENQPAVNDYNSLVRSDDPPSYPVCSPKTLAESPIVHLILRHLCALCPGSFLSTRIIDQESQMESHTEERAVASPLLVALSLATDGLAANEKSLISLLHIVKSVRWERAGHRALKTIGECWLAAPRAT
jgi:hypothetical protein